MNRNLLLLCLLLCSSTLSLAQKQIKANEIQQKSYPVNWQQLELHSRPVKQEVSNVYIPARASNNKGRSSSPLQFNVTYDDGFTFTQELRDALELGTLPLLSNLFTSDIPINILVLANTDLPDFLAAAGPGNFFLGFQNAPLVDCWYPVSLAEKISGLELNPGEPDIFIIINPNFPWYFDYTRPEAIGGRFDFVTTIFHELFHGIGFSGFAGLNEFDQGALIEQGFPNIFDFEIEYQNQRLLGQVSDPSDDLAEIYASDDLFFASQSFSAENKPKLYAPDPYAPGSSIHHLDQFTYEISGNSLMVPFGAPGEVILDPGQISLDMMADLGWVNTAITYENPPTFDLEIAPSDPLPVTVSVQTDEEVDFSTLRMIYSFNEFITVDTITFAADAGTDTYSANIPGPGQSDEVLYFFELATNSGRLVSSPGNNIAGQQIVFGFTFGIDTIPPVITHNAPEAYNINFETIVIEASVSDLFTGVDSVTVTWQLNDNAPATATMEVDPQDPFGVRYTAAINLPDKQVNDSIRYFFDAVDLANVPNTTRFPETSTINVPFQELQSSVITYVNNFDQPSDDFVGDFSITQPSGFSSPAIHSPHPYPAGGDNSTTNLIYQLKIPILLKGDLGTMSFDEIVLVEPGEPGAVFGDLEFWDYVAIEGRVVGTSEWIPFITPYDSGDRTEWFDPFFAINDGENSTAVGNPNLYRKRNIDLLANNAFSAEDLVEIRFRLFSDPFLVGWGWAIENLEIQNATTALRPVLSADAALKLFPNPIAAQPLQVELSLTGKTAAKSWQVIDPLGRIVEHRVIQTVGTLFRDQVYTQNFAPGLYTFRVLMEDGSIVRKRFLKTE